MKERLQKIIAAAGICSRRAAEDLLRQGRVQVNGQIAALGDRGPGDGRRHPGRAAPEPGAGESVSDAQ